MTTPHTTDVQSTTGTRQTRHVTGIADNGHVTGTSIPITSGRPTFTSGNLLAYDLVH